MDINNLVDELQKYSKVMEFRRPVSDREILIFSDKNGIELPSSYQELIKRFDGGELFIPGTVIYGIQNATDGLLLKTANGKERRCNYRIPSNLLIIGRLNYGDLLCIDLKNNHEVVQWDHETDEEFCRWHSLEEWLRETIDEYIRYEGGEPS